MQFDKRDSAAGSAGAADAGGAQRRNTVLRILTDLFILDGEHQNRADAAAQEDLMMALIGESGVVIRREIAERLAALKRPPQRMVNLLARDEFDVAAPLLQHSSVLSDEELADIAVTTTLDHARAIARMPSPGPASVDAIIALEDAESIVSILRNESVRPSPDAIRQLHKLARQEPAIAKALIGCQGLPAEILTELYWSATSVQRDQILSRLRIELAGSTWGQRGAQLSAPLNRADETTRLAAFQGFSAILRAQRLDAFRDLFSRAVGIDARLTARIIDDQSGEPFAIACRAVKIPAEAFIELLILYNPAVGRSVSRVFALGKAYDQIPADLAARMVESWNRAIRSEIARAERLATGPLRGSIHESYAVRTDRSASTYAEGRTRRAASETPLRRPGDRTAGSSGK